MTPDDDGDEEKFDLRFFIELGVMVLIIGLAYWAIK